ncbi:NAD(P)-binding protein [Massarina eburnea CBS 473.64]|uniref:NAD(P)-binding protein n=1 Tax=Massarina eburnea CBS 473.64 TaxID=1395130 RepID=A0A6A6RL49_9PLEO|nr:NAD(P)-binding protein [Massarina eburnea CBS 473.64]
MIKQSPPIDVSIPYDAAWVANKTVLITGGASGFGAGFVRHWAKNGATVIFGDVNTEKGDGLAREVRKETGNDRVHFIHCDVSDWQSQVNFFKEAVKLSPHGGIDTVVANAGVAHKDTLLSPGDLSAAEPAPPSLKTMDVNCTGVLYTVHLAYYWLPRNPGSEACSLDSDPVKQTRDRHLLLVGSLASLAPITFATQYCASKHAVLGLFRALRGATQLHGVRINLLCPYFMDTPIVPPETRLLIAGGSLGKVEDVVDAGTRFVADSRVLGRALVVGPKMSVKQSESGEWVVVDRGSEGSVEKALWEPCADDWFEQDPFNRTLIRALNAVQAARGWSGWAYDIVKTVMYALGLK